jgi:iron(III) transport system ATP-binding protein
MSVLVIENLSVAYNNNLVLDNCSFSVEEGEIIVVLGASGDGKSSLLKSIAGFVPRKSGKIEFRGEHVPGPDEKLLPGHDLIKLIHQDFNLDPQHTVKENIALRLLAYDKAYKESRIKKLLRLTKLTKYKHVKAIQISGGQQQRLAIARALADEPELVLLDEPFNQLDFQTKTTISNHIKTYLKKNNIAAIMVTHNGVEAMDWADRIVFLHKGKIERIDTPENFYNEPRNLHEARFFGSVNKVVINDEKIYFRPAFFRPQKEGNYNLPLAVQFLKMENLGWYGVYHFKSKAGKFKLFSTSNIQDLKTIYIQKLNIID